MTFRQIALVGLGLTAPGCLSGCSPCETREADRQRIEDNGTAIVSSFSHCSALNNSVEFYIEKPKSGKILFARASDVGDFAQFYDRPKQTIFLVTSNPSDLTLIKRNIGHYHVESIDVEQWEKMHRDFDDQK